MSYTSEDIQRLRESFSEASEAVSQAFIKQSLAWNRLSEAIRDLHEKHPTLFDQDDQPSRDPLLGTCNNPGCERSAAVVLDNGAIVCARCAKTSNNI